MFKKNYFTPLYLKNNILFKYIMKNNTLKNNTLFKKKYINIIIYYEKYIMKNNIHFKKNTCLNILINLFWINYIFILIKLCFEKNIYINLKNK